MYEVMSTSGLARSLDRLKRQEKAIKEEIERINRLLDDRSLDEKFYYTDDDGRERYAVRITPVRQVLNEVELSNALSASQWAAITVSTTKVDEGLLEKALVKGLIQPDDVAPYVTSKPSKSHYRTFASEEDDT